MSNPNFNTDYPPLSDKIILNVDDNSLNQLLITKLLQNAGAKTISAGNGEEAIEKLEKGLKPDIILMDLDMPVMNGFKTSAYIRKTLDQNVPIIINSGLISGFDKYRLRKLNISDFLEKPYNINDILSKLLKNIPEIQPV